MGRVRLTERELGIKLTNDLLLGKIKLKDNLYWLGNRKKGGIINQMLIKGATMQQLIDESGRTKRGVDAHFPHLRKRGLIISKTKSKTKNNEFVWKFEYKPTNGESKEEVVVTSNPLELNKQVYTEGKPNEVLITRYERDPSARKKCIDHYGFSCSICDFNFEKMYGKVGEGYIHVHHLKPVATAGEGGTNPINDLRPVCPNCHAMIHKRKELFSIEEIKDMIKISKGN